MHRAESNLTKSRVTRSMKSADKIGHFIDVWHRLNGYWSRIR